MEGIKKFVHFFPWGKTLFLWALVIFYFSSLPGSPYPSDVSVGYYLERKGAHVFEYFIFTLLLFGFLRKRFPRETFFILSALAFFGATLYGLSDELHQYFIPFRGARMSDVGIDMLGSFLAILLLYWYRQSRLYRKATKKPLI